jgi:hypothetical protein
MRWLGRSGKYSSRSSRLYPKPKPTAAPGTEGPDRRKRSAEAARSPVVEVTLTVCRFKPANVLGGLAANNVKQYSCFRSKLI